MRTSKSTAGSQRKIPLRRRVERGGSAAARGGELAESVERFIANCQEVCADAAEMQRLNHKLMTEKPRPLFVHTKIHKESDLEPQGKV
jgi:hypothetical protein